MSETPSTPVASDPNFAQARSTALRRPSQRRFWFAVLLASVAVLGALWAVQQGRSDSQELAKRLQQQESRLQESQSQFKLLQDALRDAQAKISVMESKVNEAAGQQAQLEKLYRALSNDSLDVALADLEGVILLAAQQAASGGSLQGPLIGLQAAEAKLDRLADPSLGNLKRALAKDVEKLKLMSHQDTGGLAQKLELISAQIDGFPLLSEPRRTDALAAGPDKSGEPKAMAARAAEKPNDKSIDKSNDKPAEKSKDNGTDRPATTPGFWGRMLDIGLGKGKVVGQDWRDLIRVTRVDNPDAALLSPEQAYFVRENLRLRLLNARMALSSRQESVLKADLERSRSWLGSYFDVRDKQVSGALEQIRQILALRAGNEPALTFESLAVVRTMRALRESKK